MEIKKTLIITVTFSLMVFMAGTTLSQVAREIPKNVKPGGSEIVFNSNNFQSGLEGGKGLGVLARENSYLDENAISFGFAAKSEEAKFFIIGTLYSETLAYLKSGKMDMVMTRLKSIEKELINLNVPNSLYHLMSQTINIIETKRHSEKTIGDFISLFQPFFEDYAKSMSEDKLILFRAGSWLMDYGLAAASGRKDMLKQPAKLAYFIEEMKRMDAPKGVLAALNEIAGIAEKEITDKDTEKVLKNVKKIQTILG